MTVRLDRRALPSIHRILALSICPPQVSAARQSGSSAPQSLPYPASLLPQSSPSQHSAQASAQPSSPPASTAAPLSLAPARPARRWRRSQLWQATASSPCHAQQCAASNDVCNAPLEIRSRHACHTWQRRLDAEPACSQRSEEHTSELQSLAYLV